MGAVSLAMLIAGFALHNYGAHRRSTAHRELVTRWGHLDHSSPPAPVPDHTNAARWLAAGGQAIVCTTEEMELIGKLSAIPADDWDPDEERRIEDALSGQHHAISLLLRAGRHETFFLGADGIAANHDEINFLAMVRGLRLLIVYARSALNENRTDDGLAALTAVSRSADGLLRTPIVSALTSGAAAQRWAARVAMEVVRDPCVSHETLIALRDALPTEDPIQRGNQTLVASVEEIADEGLSYTDDRHDPSLGWSIPFWVSNRYLLEDLVVAEILARWSRYLELGQQPVARWPADAELATWGDGPWPPWVAMAGDYTPNLLAVWARVQAAASERLQLRCAIDVRLASSSGLGPDACATTDWSEPAALTGEPVGCRYDSSSDAIVIELDGARAALATHLSVQTQAASVEVIALPVGPREDLCLGERPRYLTNANDSQGQ
jgi:hypothetical protein